VGRDGFEDVFFEFPDLTKDDFLACLQFAALPWKSKSQHFAAA